MLVDDKIQFLHTNPVGGSISRRICHEMLRKLVAGLFLALSSGCHYRMRDLWLFGVDLFYCFKSIYVAMAKFLLLFD